MKIRGKTKRVSEDKVIKIVLIVLSVIVLSYIIQAIYFRQTGAVETQSAAYVSETSQITAQGIAIRDEVREENGVNAAILKKSSKGVYMPIVSDGDNVAKGDYIAYRFSTSSQADAYRQIEIIDGKIEYLSKFKNMGTSFLEISSVNSYISLSFAEYMKALDDNDLTQIDKLSGNINYALISRQAVTGQAVDFSEEISEYTAQRKKLESLVGNKSGVQAPIAGYFVSYVDGFEASVDYDTLSEDGLTPSQVTSLLNQPTETSDSAFGKIIGNHVWYFACNIPFIDAAPLTSGSTFNVSFPDKGVENLQMTVVSSDREDDMVTVLFKCKIVSDEILHLRKEEAVISLKSYGGYKISNDALSDDGNGNIGVYVYSGEMAVFKPIVIVYRSDSYVLAQPLEKYSDGETVSDSKTLKQYDQVIVKGRNLYDGKILG